jgi:hypothetical protein
MPPKKKSKNNELQKGDLVRVSSLRRLMEPSLGGYGIIIDCDVPADDFSFPWLVLRPNGFKKWERDHNVKLIAKAKQ